MLAPWIAVETPLQATGQSHQHAMAVEGMVAQSKLSHCVSMAGGAGRSLDGSGCSAIWSQHHSIPVLATLQLPRHALAGQSGVMVPCQSHKTFTKYFSAQGLKLIFK
jgi:hypothetical protein